MVATSLAFSFLLLTISALALVVPLPDPGDASYLNSHPPLSAIQSSNSLVCHISRQSMTCFGGSPVTIQTCQSSCACEKGRVSCPSFKYCDDSTMDTFCGGLCFCQSPSAARFNEANILVSAHRFPNPEEVEVEEEDPYSYEDEDDELRKRHLEGPV